MYTFEQWKDDVIEILYDISSKEWQKKEWSKGPTEFVVTATELVCMLYNDCNFEDDFIVHERFNDEEKEILSKFNNTFSTWLDTYEESLDEHIIYFDPGWDNVREEAKKIIKLLELKV